MQQCADTLREKLQGRIAFVSHGGKEDGYVIWTMQADGSAHTGLATFPLSETVGFLAYSPDEKHLVFTAYRDGNYEIYVMNSDGSDQRRLTYTRSTTYGAAWSPDGKHIAFTSCLSGTEEVYVINADGSNLKRLTSTAYIEHGIPKACNRNPSWSPDGLQITFSSARSGNFEIYVMKADGSESQQLTRSQGTNHLPKWSPDGNHIAFMGYTGISVIDKQGTGFRQLTSQSLLDFYPTWSPDGKYIAYASRVEMEVQARLPKLGRSEIFAISIEDNQSVRLTTTETDNSYPSWIT